MEQYPLTFYQRFHVPVQMLYYTVYNRSKTSSGVHIIKSSVKLTSRKCEVKCPKGGPDVLKQDEKKLFKRTALSSSVSAISPLNWDTMHRMLISVDRLEVNTRL